MFAKVSEAPAGQALARRLEQGGVLSCLGIAAAAQPFVAAVLRHLFPQRPIVLVTEGLKTQESAQQDLATWLAVEADRSKEGEEVQSPKSNAQSQKPGAGELLATTSIHPSRFTLHSPSPLFYPAWEVLPHEARLPHADVISERLETLVALTQLATRGTDHAPLVVTSVAALLQRTFPAGAVRERTRTLTRGDHLDPQRLVEWLEAQGYEPEAQVTQKGEIALRGGILDVYPPTSPWPVRLEFVGDDLESLRQFDPLTQISREQTATVTIPPAGELGLLKQMRSAENGVRKQDSASSALESPACLGTLLEYLPAETFFLLCEPELLAERAEEYAARVPEGDPFFIPWGTFLEQARERRMTLLEMSEADPGLLAFGDPGNALPNSDTPIPLTPALSRGERENAVPVGNDSESDGTHPGACPPSLSHAPLGAATFLSA